MSGADEKDALWATGNGQAEDGMNMTWHILHYHLVACLTSNREMEQPCRR